MQKRKIALFGGTFDPIHLGHTAVAGAALEHIRGDKLVFIPAKCSPLKQTLPEAGDDDRLSMIALAIESNSKFELSDCELKKPQPSYTLETVRRFKVEYGVDASIYWLIGADALDDLPHWYRVADLIDECNVAAMFRAGCAPPDFAKFAPLWGPERVEKLRRNIVSTPLIDISSTEIRKRLAAGADVGDMLHPAVADYIRQRGLYRARAKS
ncbi:MAG TPA: nicotinate (nicotinamide) nucleotide adenylyltransferase [Sedimentisphaerales bacterium]|nr:nicotinate (nicotinamide) nucleotide adenylyltransferase [Sedimentisphaerales bacterium]